MLPIKAWAIYYADGSSFSSDDGPWAEAPPFGVVCVVYYHVEKDQLLRTFDQGEHIYTYRGEAAGDHYKMGLWQDDEGFYRVMNIARGEVIP